MATMFQIVGYVSDDDGVHPGLHFVRNWSTINPSTGAYEGIQPTFHVSEDFWNRDYPNDRAAGQLRLGWYRSYFNGALYRMSDYDAPFIGGDPQIETIPPPTGAVRLT
jgi:hypothetical protein